MTEDERQAMVDSVVNAILARRVGVGGHAVFVDRVILLQAVEPLAAELRRLEGELAEALTFVRPGVFENGNGQWECGDCGAAIKQTSQTVDWPPYPFPHTPECRPMRICQPRT